MSTEHIATVFRGRTSQEAIDAAKAAVRHQSAARAEDRRGRAVEARRVSEKPVIPWGMCAVCHRGYQLTKSGVIRVHAHGRQRGLTTCEGSGRPPAEVMR